MDPDDNDDFYIVLPSNVVTPSGVTTTNKTNNYRTFLPRALEVSDPRKYEVALAEINFPQSWPDGVNVNEFSFNYRRLRYNENVYQFILRKEERRKSLLLESFRRSYKNLCYKRKNKRIKDATYDVNPRDIAKTLNLMRPHQMKGKFYVTRDQYIAVALQPEETIEFDKSLADLLGYENTIVRGKKGLPEVERETIHTSGGLIRTSVPSQPSHELEKSTNGLTHESSSNPQSGGGVEIIGGVPPKGEPRVESSSSPPIRDEIGSIDINRRTWLLYKIAQNAIRNRKMSYHQVKADRRIDLKMSISSIFCYTNIVRPTLVGNVYVPLLRTIPVNREVPQTHES